MYLGSFVKPKFNKIYLYNPTRVRKLKQTNENETENEFIYRNQQKSMKIKPKLKQWRDLRGEPDPEKKI